MRTILAFAAVLLVVPILVLGYQMHRSHTGIGTPADYLEIEQPRTISPDDPRLHESGVPVLCYHYISARPGPLHVARVAAAVLLNLPTLDEKHFWSLPVDMFEAHLRWLDENGYTTLSAAEVADIMQGRMRAPERAVAITFDDGERSLLDHGLPLLEKYDMKATLFLVTGHVGEKWKGLDMMGWEELRLLRDSGRVSIESHSHDMHYKVKTADGSMAPVHAFWSAGEAARGGLDRVAADLRISRRLLGDRLGIRTRVLAWPYGFGNRDLDRVARETGFDATFSLSAGVARPQAESPWHIRRFTITARTTVDLLAEMVGEDRVVDDGLYGARID